MLNRKVRVVIGSKEIIGTGGYDGFRISFNVQKTILGSPNMIDMVIYNLSRDSRSIIRERKLPVTVEVGYEDEDELLLLFKGTTTSAIPTQEGADTVMNVTAMDGSDGIIYATQQITYDGPIAVATAVEEIAGTLGVGIGPILVDGEFKEKGRSFSGPTQQILDTLSNEYGFSWSVQNGVFQALSDLESLPQSFIVSPETGLQAAQPLLSGPFMVQSGVEIQALLNARLNPGQLVNLRSNLDPTLNGEYKIHNIDFTGDTHGDQWSMSMQSFIIGGVF